MAVVRQIKRQISEILEKTTAGKYLFIKKTLHKVVFRFMIPERLVKEAEHDPAMQSRLLMEHIKKCPKKAVEIQKLIDKLLANMEMDADRKEKLNQDMLYCFFAYGYSPNEYLCYEFENKSLAERRAFVSDRESVIFAYRVNERTGLMLFLDKMKTYEYLKDYYKRDAIAVSSEKDYHKFCDYVEKHAKVVKKVVSESCGRSIELIDTTKAEPKKLFADMLSQGKIILEEPIVQHPSVAALNTSSVNTVRCLTIHTDKGIEIPWCFMKVGRAGSFIDNGGAGGILVGIDPATGIFNTDGYDETNMRYSHHPDNGIEFRGFQLPEWEKMLEICREMALKIPEVGWIGWDMAYSQAGWVVVEGNSLSEVIGPQSTSKQGIRKELRGYQDKIKAFYPPASI